MEIDHWRKKFEKTLKDNIHLKEQLIEAESELRHLLKVSNSSSIHCMPYDSSSWKETRNDDQ